MGIAMAYRLTALILVVAYSVLLIWRPLEPFDDVWEHLAVGWWIWDHKAIPDETLFLWSESIPWVYHHWLTELTLYAMAAPGYEQFTIMTATVALGLVPFAVIAFASTARDLSWVAVPAVFIMEVMVMRIRPRPDLFTSIAIAVLLLMLSRFQGRLSWRWIAAVAARFVLWANCHGAVVIGLLLFGITILADAIQDRWNRRMRSAAVLLLVAVVAVHLNPYGVGYWRALTAVNSYTFSRALEWMPIWAWPPAPPQALIAIAVSGILALGAWALSPDRRLAQLGWMLLAAALFLKARRNVSVFIIVNGMVTALNARAIETQRLWRLVTRWRGPRTHDQPPLRGVVRLALISFLAVKLLALVVRPGEWTPASTLVAHLHEGSVAFLQAHPCAGRVLTDMDSAGYFHWCLKGDLPLFIDGMNAYSDQLQRDYFTILRGDRSSRLMLDSYKIDVIVLTANLITSKIALANNLDRDDNWARVYAGNDGVIWVRRREFPTLVAEVGKVNQVSFATLESLGEFIVPPIPKASSPIQP